MFFQILTLCFFFFLNSQDRPVPIGMHLKQRLASLVRDVSDQNFLVCVESSFPKRDINKSILNTDYTFLNLTLSCLNEFKSNLHHKLRVYKILDYLIKNGAIVTANDVKQNAAHLFEQTCDDFPLCEQVLLDYVFTWRINYDFFCKNMSRDLFFKVLWKALQYGIWQLHKKGTLDITREDSDTLLLKVIKQIVYISGQLNELEDEQGKYCKDIPKLGKDLILEDFYSTEIKIHKNGISVFTSILEELYRYKSDQVPGFDRIKNKAAYVDLDTSNAHNETPRKLMQSYARIKCFNDFLK